MTGAALVGVLQNGWTEDIGTWLLGLGVGACLAHRKLVKPARARHAELLARHNELSCRLDRLEAHDSAPST